jgi:excisionase family DNA binding protein
MENSDKLQVTSDEPEKSGQLSDPNWMTADQFCKLMRISRTTLQSYINAGKVPHYRLGSGRGKLFFDQKSVAVLRQECYVGPSAYRPAMRKAG